MSDPAPDGPGAGVPPEKVLPAVQRAWLALLQCALVLPFAVTKSCEGGKVEAYTGLEYYFSPDRWPFLFVLVVVIGVLVAVPWKGARSAAEAAGLGLRAWVAALGALVAVFGPFLAFLFDAPEPRIGWWLHGGGWGLTALVYLGAAVAVFAGAPRGDATVRPPERWGVVALVIAPIVAVLLHMALFPEDMDQAGIGAMTGLAVDLPLVVAGLALVRAIRLGERVTVARALWWCATAPTLLVHLAAAIGK